MKAIYDEDSATAIKTEDDQIRDWESEEAKRIKKIPKYSRRQFAWNQVFPKTTYSPEIEAMVF